MNEGLSRYFGNVREGALVIDVGSDTPAARAGLEAGDVIVRAGGQSVNDPEDVRRALMRSENGSTEIEVVRQGRRRTLNLQWEGSGVRTFRRELRPGGRRENVIIRRGNGE
jgi:S1-C subfamily serine protease